MTVPDFGKRASGGESLDAIAYSDRVLDALASQHRVQPGDAGDAELFALLGEWRDGVRSPSTTHVISERDALVALHEGLSAVPPKRGHRGLTLVASLAAAVLAIGGFGAVVSGAGPGDPLYGLRTAILGEPQTVRDDRVTLAAQTEMAEVQKLIDNGDWQQAQQKLATVSTSVQSVDDTARKQTLIDQWNQLAVKVTERDPAATVPPNAAPAPLQQLPLPSLPASMPDLPSFSIPSLPATLPQLPDLPSFSLPPFPQTLPQLPDLPSFSLPPLPQTLPSIPGLPSMTLPSLPQSLPSLSIPSLPQTAFESPSAVPGSGSGSSIAPTSATLPTATASSGASAAETAAPTSATVATSVAPQVTTPSAATPSEAVQTAPPSSAVITTTTVAPRTHEQSQQAPATQQRQHAPEVVTTTMPIPKPLVPIPGMG